MTYSVVKSYVKHHIPFVQTQNVVVEGYNNKMRGSSIRKSLFLYYVEGNIINSHGRPARYSSNWFYLGSPKLGLFLSIGKANGYPTNADYTPYLSVGCSKGLRDWGLMLGMWKGVPGIITVSYWREQV